MQLSMLQGVPATRLKWPGNDCLTKQHATLGSIITGSHQLRKRTFAVVDHGVQVGNVAHAVAAQHQAVGREAEAHISHVCSGQNGSEVCSGLCAVMSCLAAAEHRHSSYAPQPFGGQYCEARRCRESLETGRMESCSSSTTSQGLTKGLAPVEGWLLLTVWHLHTAPSVIGSPTRCSSAA